MKGFKPSPTVFDRGEVIKTAELGLRTDSLVVRNPLRVLSLNSINTITYSELSILVLTLMLFG